jgi:RNA polymerase sigma-70 factor (ECF subfamily)
MSDRNDSELIAHILATKGTQDAEDAYRILLERYWKVVLALLRSRVRSERDAEDLAQETFIRAFRSLPKLNRRGHFLAWLARIAQNLATDHLRRRRTPASLDRIEDESLERSRKTWQASQEVQDRLERQEEMELVLNALGELPARHRVVVTLRYLKGLSNREIAALLGEPEGTVRNRLFRALAKLRTVLEGQEPSKT